MLGLMGSGVAVAESIRLALVVTPQIVIGGSLWILLRTGRTSIPEIVGVGTAFGLLLFIFVGQSARGDHSFWLWFSCELVAATFFVVVSGPRAGRMTDTLTIQDVGYLFGAYVVGLATLVPVFRENHVSPNFPVIINGIAPAHESWSAAVQQLGPLESLSGPAGSLRYHWFANGWVGLTDAVGQASPFVTQTRLLPLTACLGIVTLSWSISKRLTPNRLSALLAAGLGAAGGALGMQFGTDCARIPVNQFSPSVVLGGPGAAAEVKRVVSEPDAVANGLSGRAISYAP